MKKLTDAGSSSSAIAAEDPRRLLGVMQGRKMDRSGHAAHPELKYC